MVVSQVCEAESVIPMPEIVEVSQVKGSQGAQAVEEGCAGKGYPLEVTAVRSKSHRTG